MKNNVILRNSLYELLYQLLIIIRGFILSKLIINVFGSNINGLIVSITNFLAYITLLDAGVNVVIKSRLYKPIVDDDKEQIAKILGGANNFFKRIALIFIIYIIGLLIMYPLINNNFKWDFIDLLIIVISISTFIEYYLNITYRIFLQASGKSYIVSIVNSIITIISTIVVVILINKIHNIIIIKLISNLILILSPIIFSLYTKRKYKLNIKNKKEYKIKDKWDGLYQHIAWVIYNKTDIIVLTLFSSLINVSIYSIYSFVCIGLRNLINAITSGIDATFGKIIAKGNFDLLNKKFNIYEIIYYSLIPIIFSTAILMIIPFVKVYTIGINDANYINYPFGIIMIICQFVIAIRIPYRALIHGIGHFKETKNGAIIECILNILISIILVFKLGLVGVAIGSLVSTLVRTVEFIYHANKYILKRNIISSIKKILIIIVETIIIILVSKYISYGSDINYLNFFINLLITILISTIIVGIINLILYNKEIKNLIKLN